MPVDDLEFRPALPRAGSLHPCVAVSHGGRRERHADVVPAVQHFFLAIARYAPDLSSKNLLYLPADVV